MGILIEIAVLVLVFYLGKLHERYGSAGKAARHIHDKATSAAQKVADDFNKKDAG